MTIDKLTKEQEARIPEFIEKWVKNTHKNNNREAAQKSVGIIYKRSNLKEPTYIHVKSPREAIFSAAVCSLADFELADDEARLKAIAEYGPKVPAETLKSICGGILSSQWLSSSCGWFDYGKYIGAKFSEEQYKIFYEYCKAVFACLPYEKVCFIIDKPIEVHFKDKNLHNENGPAVLFADGYCMYSLNGVRVPEWLVTTPAEEIDPLLLLKEKNAEIRREIVRKVSIERVCEKLDTKVIDTLEAALTEDENNRKIWVWPWKKEHAEMVIKYELLELKLPGMQTKARYLKMQNPSIGTHHVEGVPQNIKTCQEALDWRCGGFRFAPSQLT